MRNFPISFSSNILIIVATLKAANTGNEYSDSSNLTQYRIRAIGVDNRDYSQIHDMIALGI